MGTRVEAEESIHTMKQQTHLTSPRLAIPALAVLLTGLLSSPALAQDYLLIDLSPASGNGLANGVNGTWAAGTVAEAIFGTSTRATLWTEEGRFDLHPAFLDGAVGGAAARSYIHGLGGGLMAGAGVGPGTGGRLEPLLWTAGGLAVQVLPVPFTHFGGQATATDGVQVVGHATGLDRDGTVAGPTHAVVWDAATGVAVDLGDGGNGAMAYGVGGGVQVGFVNKGGAAAALWRGSRGSQVVLHPKDAVVSVANDTDGFRQVGYAGYDVRVRQEAAKGNKYQRFNYAYVWTGTAASGGSIHPYPVNSLPGIVLSQSYALAVNGDWIVGYAGDQTKFGTPAYSHAIVWDAGLNSVDLNAYLPAGFVGAQALAVDADGNVSGFIAKSDGTRHAAVWRRQPLP